MTRSIHRRSFAVRLLSAAIVFAVLVSFSGIGYAVPGAGKAAPVSGESTVTPQPDPKTDPVPSDKDPVAEPPVVAPPDKTVAEEPAVVTGDDPKVLDQGVTVTDSIGDDAKATATGVPVTAPAPVKAATIVAPTCENVTKTFKLYADNVPGGATFWVRYKIGESIRTLNLSGSSSPYRASIDLAYGTTIKWVEWYSRYGGADTLLHTDSEAECLRGDVTNSFTYDSFLAGRKFHDLDANGKYDDHEPWLKGWTIELRRASDSSLYATRTTNEDGCYSFRDVLPGEYYVVEVMQPGWCQTQAPDGTVRVANGTCIEGLCFGNVQVLSAIDVTKVGDSIARVGDTIEYEIVVKNTGSTKLVDVQVNDPMFGGLIGSIPELAPGASQTFTPSHLVTAGDPDPLNNTVTASGIDLCKRMVVDTASWSCDIVHPSIALDKSVSPGIVAFGGQVLYTYVIENTGDVPLYGLSLYDDVLGSLDGLLPSTTLGVGEKMTVESFFDVTADVTNVATVVAVDSWETKCQASDDAVVDVRNPAISIVKSATPDMVYTGEPVTYTYLISNTGDTTLWEITLSDNVLGDLTYLLPATMLPVGGSMTAQITVPVADDVVNVGTVEAMYGEMDTDFYGGPVSAQSEAGVDVIAPSLAVRKTATPSVILAGETVEYTYEVENTGDVPLYGVMLADDHLGSIALDKVTLAPGEIAYGTASAAIWSDTTNVATALATDPLQRLVTAKTSAVVDVVAPAIGLVKTVAPSVVAYGGDVAYTYTVTNTGDTPLYGITVDDDVIGHIGDVAFLDVGASAVIGPVMWTVSADTYNVATAAGTDGWKHPVKASDDAFVDVRYPGLALAKAADPTVIHVGDDVTYTYLLTNTGDTDLWNVTLSDDVLGDLTPLLPSTFLAAGASMTVQITVPVDADVTNTGVATGSYGEPGSGFGGALEAFSSASVDVIHPDMVVRKTADPTVVLSGESVTYTYEVENTGDVILDAVTLVDDQLGPIDLGVSTLAPGEIAHGSASAAITVDTVNVATATAIDPLQMELQRTAEARVDVVHPAIQVFKSVMPWVVVYSGEVTYQYSVYNPGDVDLSDVTLVDDQLGTIASGLDLAAGAWLDFTQTALIDEDTVNRVDATGHDEWGHEVASWATAEVDVIHPAVDIVKTADAEAILAGEDVTYTYVVTNTGDVTLNSLDVVDDKLGPVGTHGPLEPGGTWTFTATAAIAEDTVNVATVTGYYSVMANDEVPVVSSVTDSDDAEIDVVAPAISVTKAADKDFVIEPGEDVLYTYTVTNTGDVPLFDVVLDDDVLGAVGAIGMLDVGESTQFQASDFVETDVTNTVIATARDEWGHEVGAEATWSVVYQPLAPLPPDLAVTKSANKATASPGELVTYTLTYTNTEDPLVAPNAIAEDFTIADDFDGRYASVVDAAGGTVAGSGITWAIAGPLAPGESGTITYTMRIDSTMPLGTTNVDNVVVIRSTGDPNPDNDSDTARVRVSTGSGTEEEPFLPFTGGEFALFLGAIACAVATGAGLRRYASRVS